MCAGGLLVFPGATGPVGRGEGLRRAARDYAKVAEANENEDFLYDKIQLPWDFVKAEQ